MTLTYRTRRRLHRLGVTLGYALLAILIIGICWSIWLKRFVVYGQDGVRFDFAYTSPEGVAQVAEPPEEATVAIYYNEGDDFVNTSTELTQLIGYYATTDMLVSSLDTMWDTIGSLPSGSAVMLDMKSIYGTFYYTSKLPDAVSTDQLDVTKMDELIQKLAEKDIYLIARIPAFRDRNYGLNYTNYGLAVKDGGYLWCGDDNCYWLNPTSNGTLSWLISIVNELKDLGFDEVVFTDFCFPDTTNILFESSMSRQEALEAAAETLVSTCATSRFAVSFETGNASFALPEGRSRLYLTGVDADEAASVSESTTVADKAINLVFLTNTNDTRFEEFGVMRPMPGL